MAKGLWDYIKDNPATSEEPPQVTEDRQRAERAREQARKDRESVDRAKEAIVAGLSQGTAPQYLLYRAIDAISLLDRDPDWGEPLKKKLDEVFADLAQESFLVDNAAIAAERLDKLQKEHNEKLRKNLKTRIRAQERMEAELREALKILDELEGKGETPLEG